MAGYKYPRRIEFMDCLPKDGVGKLQRRLLRERFKTLVIDGGRPTD
jgi:acyl-CoA synthetase (AMP-forming)/AMP-acid ligase II